MSICHTEIGAVAVEPHELVGVISQPRVIVARDPNVGREPRKAAGAAGEALWNIRIRW